MYDKFNKWFNSRYKTIIRLSYLIPILFVAGVSIAHVIEWYSMTNPSTWAIYLSIGIEIAALSALAGLAVKKDNSVYLPFIIVTFIQFIGNIFYAFQYIDINSQLFKDWVTLVGPIFDGLSIADITDIDSHRRWLSVLGGGLLPMISLTFLHLLVKFNDKDEIEPMIPESEIKPEIIETPTIKEEVLEYVDDITNDEVIEKRYDELLPNNSNIEINNVLSEQVIDTKGYWDEISNSSDVVQDTTEIIETDIDFSEPYEDNITYDIVESVSEEPIIIETSIDNIDEPVITTTEDIIPAKHLYEDVINEIISTEKSDTTTVKETKRFVEDESVTPFIKRKKNVDSNAIERLRTKK